MNATQTWMHARRQYDRLCTVHEPGNADSLETAARNRTAALPILREALAHEPDLEAIVRAVAAGEPMDAEGIRVMVRDGEAMHPTTIPTELLRLSQEPYGLLDRRAYAHPQGGHYFRYWLSPLGRLVMGAEAAPESLDEACWDGNPFARFGLPWVCYTVLRRADRPMPARDIHAVVHAERGAPVSFEHVRNTLYKYPETFSRVGIGRFQIADAGGRP